MRCPINGIDNKNVRMCENAQECETGSQEGARV